MLLDKINEPNDIKKLDSTDYDILAKEIREFLIEKISVTGGHLGSILGTVELTMALHLALDLPEDKIVWDVGHQSYTHKLLTGRRDGFDNLRKHGGMSGFPKRKESNCDAFDTGTAEKCIIGNFSNVTTDINSFKIIAVSKYPIRGTSHVCAVCCIKINGFKTCATTKCTFAYTLYTIWNSDARNTGAIFKCITVYACYRTAAEG